MLASTEAVSTVKTYTVSCSTIGWLWMVSWLRF